MLLFIILMNPQISPFLARVDLWPKRKSDVERASLLKSTEGVFHIIYGKEIALQFAPLWHLGLILWENQNLRGDTECLVGIL